MNLADISKLGVANPFRQRYDNYIGGKFVAPVKGEYFANVTPISGQPFCEIARSTAEDVELALDAAHAAKDAWAKTSPAERANILNRIADRMEQNLRLIATTGMRNAAIDVEAAHAQGITVCGTSGASSAVPELTIGMIIALLRNQKVVPAWH